MFLTLIACNNSLHKKTVILQEIENLYSNEKYRDCLGKINENYKNVKNDDPWKSELMRIEAKCLFKLEEFERCIIVVSEIIDDFPNDPSLYEMRGDCYQITKNVELARRDYTTLIKKLKNFNSFNKRGLLYFKMGYYDLANTDLDSALFLDSMKWAPLNNKGLVLVELGDYEGGIKYYQKALSVEKNKLTYFNIGWVYDKLGQKDSVCYYWKISSDMGLEVAKKYYNVKCKKYDTPK